MKNNIKNRLEKVKLFLIYNVRQNDKLIKTHSFDYIRIFISELKECVF